MHSEDVPVESGPTREDRPQDQVAAYDAAPELYE
jgi:hypothetical protein